MQQKSIILKSRLSFEFIFNSIFSDSVLYNIFLKENLRSCVKASASFDINVPYNLKNSLFFLILFLIVFRIGFSWFNFTYRYLYNFILSVYYTAIKQ